jgi:NAD(P)-dependent dehydrogenase (short-subunit alcohol dehydrogenase family)
MNDKPLLGKTVLVTGGVRRIGGYLVKSLAAAGANIVIHYSHFPERVEKFVVEIEELDVKTWTIRQDFNNFNNFEIFLKKAFSFTHVDFLINNAAIFEEGEIRSTTLNSWQRHLNINLTAPFLLCQAFASQIRQGEYGRIVNILDWRALRPGIDHFPYTISKAALASLTKAAAVALAPNIQVNGIAFGAILPPVDGTMPEKILDHVPLHRLGTLEEVGQTIMFLLTGPTYLTGEIISLDGGRHLT